MANNYTTPDGTVVDLDQLVVTALQSELDTNGNPVFHVAGFFAGGSVITLTGQRKDPKLADDDMQGIQNSKHGSSATKK